MESKPYLMKYSYTKVFLFLIIGFGFITSNLKAQKKTFEYHLTLQGEASTGKYLPFWLYSNRHGIVSFDSPESQAIFNFQKNLMNHHSGFDYGFGATLVGRYSKHKTIFFSQLYGVLSFGPFQLKGGRFYETLGTVDPSLSMGSLAISPNATPLPKITFSVPVYTDVPFTHGYVEFKGQMDHGWFEENRQIHRPWLFQKDGYLRFGKNWPVRPYIGLTDETQWAGTSPYKGNLTDSFRSFIRVFLNESGHGTKNRGENIYHLGNTQGIWDFGFYFHFGGYHMILYRQQIYNDKDGLTFQTPDGMTGLSIKVPQKKQHFIKKVVLEYLYTKNQSGPIPPGGGRGGPGGRDDYYNNYIYRSGWTYEKRTIGNPLFLNAYNPQLKIVANPHLNTKNPYGIANNRIVAQHIGLRGQFSKSLSYKVLLTRSINYGNYYDGDLYRKKGLKTDFFSRPKQWSFLTKFSFQPTSDSYKSLTINLSLAGDFGQLYQNRMGIMVGLKFRGTSSF